ncbi:MAG: toxin-antitoxin system, partial [Acidiferrobacterales bacterium]
MAQVLVRGLDNAVVERLKQRASQHGRSLQGELRYVL